VNILIITDRVINKASTDMVAKFIRDLSLGLARLGYKVSLLCKTGSEINLVQVFTADNEEQMIRSIRDKLFKFDVISSHTNRNLIYNLQSVDKLPVCATFHDIPKSIPSLIDFPCFIGASNLVCNQSSLVVGCPVRLIYDTLDPSNYDVCGKKGDYVLYNAPITEDNGVYDAFEICKTQNLKIIGNIGNETSTYIKLSHRKEMIGRVGVYAERYLLRNAKCLLVPQRSPICNGLSIVEANLCGTPVVIRNVLGANEYVSEGVNFLFDKNEDASDCIEQLGESSSVDASVHSFEDMLNQYVDLFRDVAVFDRW